MKRTVAVIAGLLLLLLGLGAGALGAVAIAVFGSEGTYRVEVADVRSDGVALYVRAFGLEQQVIPEGLLEVSLTASGETGQDVFLGVGPVAQVQSYLSGVPYSAAAELSDGAFATNEVPGAGTPPPPGEQSFWVAQASGTAATLLWQPSYRADILVIMNSDASAPVAAKLAAEMGTPQLFPAALAAVGLGLALVVLAFWLLLRAGRHRTGATAD